MKAILAVGGYRDGNTRSYVERMIELTEKKKPKVVYLPTAARDNMWDEAECYMQFLEMGCKVDVIKLSEYKKGSKKLEKLILGADIVYALSGNLKILMEEWIRTGADELIKTAYENGAVLSGSSSGAMCWFDRGYDNCGVDRSYMFVDCMGLIPHCLCPHYDTGTWNTFDAAVKQQSMIGIAANNGVAFEFIDGKCRLIPEDKDTKVYIFDPENGFKKKVLRSGKIFENKNESEK